MSENALTQKNTSLRKKILVVVGVLFALSLIVILVGAIVMVPKFRKFQGKALQTTVQAQLRLISVQLDMDRVEDGVYKEDSFEAWKKNYGQSENSHYKFAYDTETDSLVAQHCPDCGIFVDRYKVMGYGNIDDDETLDIWIVDHKGKIENITNDIEKK